MLVVFSSLEWYTKCILVPFLFSFSSALDWGVSGRKTVGSFHEWWLHPQKISWVLCCERSQNSPECFSSPGGSNSFVNDCWNASVQAYFPWEGSIHASSAFLLGSWVRIVEVIVYDQEILKIWGFGGLLITVWLFVYEYVCTFAKYVYVYVSFSLLKLRNLFASKPSRSCSVISIPHVSLCWF